MKKIGGDKPVGVIIHTYICGNIIRKCPSFKQAKISFFKFFLSFFYKIGEQEGRTGPAGWGGGC
jgi:hypothetical protein